MLWQARKSTSWKRWGTLGSRPPCTVCRPPNQFGKILSLVDSRENSSSEFFSFSSDCIHSSSVLLLFLNVITLYSRENTPIVEQSWADLQSVVCWQSAPTINTLGSILSVIKTKEPIELLLNIPHLIAGDGSQCMLGRYPPTEMQPLPKFKI